MALRVLVRGVGDIGSAVAHRLFLAGHVVVVHDGEQPTTTRRGMAFADAIFDGRTRLDGVEAIRVDAPDDVPAILAHNSVVPIVVWDFTVALGLIAPDVLIDARMRKRDCPETQRGLSRLAIGLDPNFVAGETTDVVVETSWEQLGRVVTRGTALPLRGEPHAMAGHARDRYVYAPVAGTLFTSSAIGQQVAAGEVHRTNRREVPDGTAHRRPARVDARRSPGRGRDESDRDRPAWRSSVSARNRRAPGADRRGRGARDGCHAEAAATATAHVKARTRPGAVGGLMFAFLWEMRPYSRQVAGQLVLGSVAGIIMNTAVVLPAILLGRAIDRALSLELGEATAADVGWAALAFIGGTLLTEVPRIAKRWWLMTANARIRANSSGSSPSKEVRHDFAARQRCE